MSGYSAVVREPSADPRTIVLTSINPATGLPIAEHQTHNDAGVDDALTGAVTAQRDWRQVPVQERVKLLTRLALMLREGAPEHAALITLEMGKPLAESAAEIEKCAKVCDFYANRAPTFLADEVIDSNAAESSIVFDPLGVILAIMPWNYPFWQLFRFAAPALAAGNGVILKHAGNVPQCALAIETIMQKAGIPDGLFRTLLITPAQTMDVLNDERIAAVTLTGSTHVGSLVAAAAGKILKKQVLELGGSDPFVVLADADVEQAAAMAVKARFSNAGQSCVSAKRFIVEESVGDRFADAFCAGAAKLVMGDPRNSDTHIGPMARADLRDELHIQVQRTVAAGAVLKLGGELPGGKGFYYPPTVLDHVTPTMAAFRQETFGPLAAIIRVRSADEALEYANDTEFGLGAAVWTKDVDRARQFARKLDAGAVFINGMVASDARLPFGGIKKSGYGRELGLNGIREFVNIKTLWIGPAQVG